MSDSSSLPGASGSDPEAQTLTDRVLARVSHAADAADRHARATRPRLDRRRQKVADALAAEVTRTPEQVRETRSLRRVFLELGDSYREYRKRTGEPVSDDVRAAADRFRRELNLPALVSVAESLERHEILTL